MTAQVVRRTVNSQPSQKLPLAGGPPARGGPPGARRAPPPAPPPPAPRGNPVRPPPPEFARSTGLPSASVTQRSSARVEETPVDSSGAVLDSEWERVDLPSDFVPYAWDSVSVRRFGVMDHAKVARANRHKNTSLLLDVLSSTCNRDARELVFNDLQALMIWHKLNSYLNTPYTVSWNSKYGERGSQNVTATVPRAAKLAKTRADYRAWRERGCALPTARDVEVFESVGDDAEDVIFLFDRAQWLDPAPLSARVEELTKGGDRAAIVTARIEELERRGMKFFPVIDKFAEEFSGFGVQEFASVKLDAKLFDPVKAVASLRSANTEAAMLELQSAGDETAAAKVAANIEEANRMQALIDAGRPEACAPQPEEVPLVFSLWGMFPYI